MESGLKKGCEKEKQVYEKNAASGEQESEMM
jgi:hypothetical protein